MSDHDIHVLNSLITTTLDSVKGYREAASDEKASRYSGDFARFASERSAVASQLQAQVRNLGGTPEDDSSVLGAAHRGLMSLKDAIVGNDEKAIINEVERGEDVIKAKYEAALRDDELTPQSRSVIEAGYSSVRQGHDWARDLKHSLA